MSVDADLFRHIMGAFPSGVTVITALSSDGTARGMTSTAFSSISLEPPIVSVSIDARSATLKAIDETRAFVVNILNENQAKLSNHFASKLPDKFKGLQWTPGSESGAPILTNDIAAYAECGVLQRIEAGDHVLLLGLVCQGAVHAANPLMYFRREYAGWRTAGAN